MKPDEFRLIDPTEELQGEYVAYVEELLEVGERVHEVMLEAARGAFTAFVRRQRGAATYTLPRPRLPSASTCSAIVETDECRNEPLRGVPRWHALSIC